MNPLELVGETRNELRATGLSLGMESIDDDGLWAVNAIKVSESFSGEPARDGSRTILLKPIIIQNEMAGGRRVMLWSVI